MNAIASTYCFERAEETCQPMQSRGRRSKNFSPISGGACYKLPAGHSSNYCSPLSANQPAFAMASQIIWPTSGFAKNWVSRICQEVDGIFWICVIFVECQLQKTNTQSVKMAMEELWKWKVATCRRSCTCSRTSRRRVCSPQANRTLGHIGPGNAWTSFSPLSYHPFQLWQVRLWLVSAL